MGRKCLRFGEFGNFFCKIGENHVGSGSFDRQQRFVPTLGQIEPTFLCCGMNLSIFTRDLVGPPQEVQCYPAHPE